MKSHLERHRNAHVGWLRAAVLGANDGIVSTASLIMGVAASQADLQHLLVTGTAGLVAGAMAMAAGEYVSVSSQVDTEQADLARERDELRLQPAHEIEELTHLFMNRGLDRGLARQVAEQLTVHDALGTHAREELGLTEITRARPLQAAATSAFSFSVGAGLPLLTVLVAPTSRLERFEQWTMPYLGIPGVPLIVLVGSLSLLALMLLGGLAAYVGRSPVMMAIGRVTLWGCLSMGLTATVGFLFGAS